MNRSRRSFALMLAFLFIAVSFMPAMAALSAAGVDAGDEGSPELAEWTFMVYLDADNNLESDGVNDLNEMELAGSTDDVNVIALMDRADAEAAGADYDDKSNGDWTDSRVFRVNKNSDMSAISTYEEGTDMWMWGELAGKSEKNDGDDWSEANMGDPETLIAFVNWTATNYPAKHYFLDMWDHGGGFYGICWDDTSNDHKADVIKMDELGYALKTISDMGIHLDIIGFDACLMGEMEVLYEVAPYADYCVASSYSEPSPGWDYGPILGRLIARPSMSSLELGMIVVEEYYKFYTDDMGLKNTIMGTTFSLYDLSAVGHAVLELEKFSRVLVSSSTGMPDSIYFAAISRARALSGSYGYTYLGPFDYPDAYPLRDLVSFARNVEADNTLPHKLRVSAGRAADASLEMNAMTMHDTMSEVMHYSPSIYFPSGTQSVMSDRYDHCSFIEDTFWPEFLKSFDSRTRSSNTPPMINVDMDMSSECTLLRLELYDVEQWPEVYVSNDGSSWERAGDVIEWYSPNLYLKASDGSYEFSETYINDLMVIDDDASDGASVVSSSLPVGIMVIIACVIIASMAVLVRNGKIKLKLPSKLKRH